tara:strand:+ start:369 stop:623 length:255 start_codon:yes stop_codon:yes gene_type:complete
MKENEESLEKKSFQINIKEFDVILRSIRFSNSEEKLGSTDLVDLWNGTKKELEKQGFECGWLTRNNEVKNSPVTDHSMHQSKQK